MTCGPNPVCYTPLRPFYSAQPNVGTIGYLQSGGSSSYHALQTSAERRLSHGLTFNINYTYAHSLDNSTGLSEEGAGGYGSVPSQVSTLEYGNSTLDLRNRLAGNIDYALPFGEHASGLRGLATKGWQLNLIGVINSGTPYTVTNATDVGNTEPGQNNVDRPIRLARGTHRTRRSRTSSTLRAFAAQTPGTIGTERRDQLFGPHYRHLDLSASKTFPLGERFNLEFRAESFNLTNTTNFAVPNASLGGANYGAITATSTAYTPREFQFALKLTF